MRSGWCSNSRRIEAIAPASAPYKPHPITKSAHHLAYAQKSKNWSVGTRELRLDARCLQSQAGRQESRRQESRRQERLPELMDDRQIVTSLELDEIGDKARSRRRGEITSTIRHKSSVEIADSTAPQKLLAEQIHDRAKCLCPVCRPSVRPRPLLPQDLEPDDGLMRLMQSRVVTVLVCEVSDSLTGRDKYAVIGKLRHCLKSDRLEDLSDPMIPDPKSAKAPRIELPIPPMQGVQSLCLRGFSRIASERHSQYRFISQLCVRIVHCVVLFMTLPENLCCLVYITS
nr:hypothetical protein CFP56_53366 [Quercus suber]